MLLMEQTVALKRVTSRKLAVEKNGETVMYRMKKITTISETIFFCKIHSLKICNIHWLIFSKVLNSFNISSKHLKMCLHTSLHNITWYILKKQLQYEDTQSARCKNIWGWTNLWMCNHSRLKSRKTYIF